MSCFQNDKCLSDLHAAELERVHSTAVNLHAGCDDTMLAMGIIFRITEVMLHDTSHQETCQKIVDIIIEETGFENGSILLYDSASDSLQFTAASNCAKIYKNCTSQDFNSDLSFERNSGIAWEVFESQVPVFIEDSSKQEIPAVQNAKVFPGSLACLPLASTGVLNLSCMGPVSFSTRKKRDFVILASVIGNILQCTAKGEKLNAYHHQLQNMVSAQTVDLNNVNRELRASMRYMEAVIDNAPQGICLIDTYGTVRNINSAVQQDIGCQPRYIVGESIGKLFKDQGHYRQLREALESATMLRLPDIPVLRADGTTIAADVYIHPVKEHDNSSQGAMVVIHNITEQKQASRQLAYVEKLRALGTMAGGIAHDFNNLLAAIQGNAELLEMELSDPQHLKRIENIKIAVADGAHSVKRLQAFTGFGAEEKYHKKLSTEVISVVHDVIDLTKPRWKDELESQGITIDIEIALSPLPPVAIHESDLREILTNIILNAVEAMPSGGTIRFTNTSKDGMAIISVKDTGTGMPEAIMNRIFDPYYSTKGIDNSGLGLSVAMGLVSQADGSISVKSRKGEGTTFFLRLPLVAEEEATPEPEGNEADETSALNILAVDDEAQIVELLSLMITEAGHNVHGCSEPAEAINLIEQNRFDLILTDLGMPGISGWEIAEKAKTQGIPVILLTGWGTQYEDTDLSKKGIRAVVSKPFRFTQLIDVINEAAVTS